MPKAAKTPIPAAIPPAPARAAPGPSPLPAPTRDPIADLISRWPADVPLAVLHSADPDSPYARWSLIACPSARGAGAGLLPRAPRSKPGVLLPVPVEPAERARVPASFPSLLPIARPPSIPVLIDPPGRSRSILELPPFTSGYLGYLSYDAGKLLEPRACHHPGAANDRAWPLSRWLRIDDALIYDHRHAQWWGLGNHAMLLSALAKSQEPKANSLSPLTSTTGRATFLRQVQAALDYIRAGDIYQVNLAHRLTATLQGSPRSLFLALSQSARPWYGAYLEFTDDQGRERAIASASPELFLEFDPQTRRILTRPMKGTRRGDADPNELLSSPKDQAELNMITDLMRNDLGRICEFGSVRVDSPRDLERHGRATPHTGSRSEGAHDRSHGWSTAQRCATRGQPAQDSLAPEGRTNPPSILQTTATVSGTVRASLSPADILSATFPGGSITGAPKIRAMQIIDELEPVARGPYCGAIGFLGDDSRLTLSIAIRTALLTSCPDARPLAPSPREGVGGGLSWAPRPANTGTYTLDYSVGAGIVADSDPDSEWAETLAKAAILECLSPSSPVGGGAAALGGGGGSVSTSSTQSPLSCDQCVSSERNRFA